MTRESLSHAHLLQAISRSISSPSALLSRIRRDSSSAGPDSSPRKESCSPSRAEVDLRLARAPTMHSRPRSLSRSRLRSHSRPLLRSAREPTPAHACASANFRAYAESHIHSLVNVLRYCNLDESLQEEDSLVCHSALERLFKTRELDYMSYIVLRMFENTEVLLEDPKRFRIEMTFSRGADLSPLEKQNTDVEAALLHQEHTLPIMGPERLQEVGAYLTLEKMEKMLRPFAMPAEDFPPPPIPQPQALYGYLSKSAGVLERWLNLWPFNKHATSNSK